MMSTVTTHYTSHTILSYELETDILFKVVGRFKTFYFWTPSLIIYYNNSIIHLTIQRNLQFLVIIIIY